MEKKALEESYMGKYNIRRAVPADLEEILNIYATARRFMAENGNPNQWGADYPGRELLLRDMKQGCLYVLTRETGICGVFFFAVGDEPTYDRIENGAWRSDAPYGTIHRIAGDGSGGVFAACLEFCEAQIGHLRIDTHHDNQVMQHVVEKNGFSPRGIIYVADGTPRIAYDRI